MPQALPVGPLVVYLGDEPPGTSDDSATIRARRGYWWVDRNAAALWVCVDPAEGAAVWYRLGNAEDLAAIAWSGDAADLSGTLDDARLSQAVRDSLALADSAIQASDLGSAAYEDVTAFDAAGSAAAAETAARGYTDDQIGLLGSAAQEDASAFDPAGSAAAVASDLVTHEQRTDNPHNVTAGQVGADPVGSAAAAENNAKSYTDSAIGGLGSAAHEHVGTQPLELPRNTELGSGAFAPYEPLSLYPITPAAAHILAPDDSGKIVWSAAHDITLPDSAAPGIQPGWRVWIKNTDGVSSITIDCGGSGDTLDGNASLSLAAGESVLIVMIASGEFGSL